MWISKLRCAKRLNGSAKLSGDQTTRRNPDQKKDRHSPRLRTRLPVESDGSRCAPHDATGITIAQVTNTSWLCGSTAKAEKTFARFIATRRVGLCQIRLASYRCSICRN